MPCLQVPGRGGAQPVGRCCRLGNRRDGWRLLSEELGRCEGQGLQVRPVCYRPVTSVVTQTKYISQ